MVSPIEGVRIEHRAYADLPGIHSLLVHADERLWCMVKETYAVALIFRGHAESWSPRGVINTDPGDLAFDEPASVHRDLRREGRARFQLINFDPRLVREHAESLGIHRPSHLRAPTLAQRHPDRPALLALHRAFRGQPDRLTREVIVSEALDALVRQFDQGRKLASAGASRQRLGRAVEYINAHLEGGFALDDLAVAAGLDRFHLCRAFRQEYGLPPYAYALKARVARACQLLIQGRPVIDVASSLGFCDQSQLHRHFRRAVGLAPGAYSRAVRTDLGR